MLITLFAIFFISISAQNFAQVQDSVQSDTLSSEQLAADTTHAKIDSLEQDILAKILFTNSFSEISHFITKGDILMNDYRYTGDFLKHFPFSFERSYGFIGQPNDIYLYGKGSGATSYLLDGLSVSSLFYLLDFNHIQSEDIDSIEIVPLPKGFLYGFSTKPIAANFITKDVIPSKPYSRIKYYEGPFGEAFIDGIFSMNLFRDLIASVDITNRKVDDSYSNSAFSIWQAKAKVRYNFSDKVNLIGNYYFSKSNTGINGGVNVDKIRETTTDITSTLYNETLAPVYFEKNSLDFKQHNFVLKALSEPFSNAFIDLNVYYKFSLEEYHQFYLDYNSKTQIKNKIYGITFDQRIKLNNLCFSLLSGYQILKNYPEFFSTSSQIGPTYSLIFEPTETKSFYLSPEIKMSFLNNKLIPSVYGKVINIAIKNTLSETKTSEFFGGFGTDLFFNVTDELNLYVGYSNYDDIISQTTTDLLEARLTYSGENYKTVLIAFSDKYRAISTSGIALSGYYKYWKFLFEGKFSQYFRKQSDPYDYFNLPKSNALLGVFVRDSFFSSNLDLKAGLQAQYTAKQNLRFLIIPYKGFESSDVPSSLTIDFTLTAEIQKAAIVYFTWENLLNRKYYITPFYPMLQRNIRFGIAWEIFN